MDSIDPADSSSAFDTSSSREFVEYYEKQSLSGETRQRFEAIRRRVLNLASRGGILRPPLRAVDIGCGPGMQCVMWAAAGDRAYGIDVNAPLIEVARQRAVAAGLDIRFDVGSATALPYETGSMDVCLLPELLEHVADWQPCVEEAVRVLRPGGILFMSTTNRLCPVQQEYNLPLYSWYPTALKRRYEKLVVTTRPELANYARYPAVHWFTYYGLARFLQARGMKCLDRFDMMETDNLPATPAFVVQLIRRSSLLRLIGQICTPSTIVFAVKA